MNLIVDVGNTQVKFAVFKQNQLLEKRNLLVEDFSEIFLSLCADFPMIKHCIISSVGKLDAKAVQVVESKLKTVFLSSQTPIPFENHYQTPLTLGVDRIALTSAAALEYPKKNVLVIDAGTCITYDFLNAENHYLGGAISPGIAMRYQALNNLTANLPLLSLSTPKQLTGSSTEEAIHSGVVYGVLNEIDGIIAAYEQKYTDLTVILTGGNANFLSKQLKSSIFANSNFLLEGLNYILQFNLNE